ncbi:MAG: NDMA-dependent alcohol dehydrogenase [Actinomycetota bacterium]|nr:NDMA-dependent alcohol dehydrogenase [Actinomycetota bacterium]
MKSRAAVLHGVGQKWSVEEIEIDPPKAGEVLVKTAYAGLCHSDEHLVTGDMVPPPEALEAMGARSMFPIIGGHEGSGIVAAVGEGVTTVAVGDHVSCSFIPSCGRCHYCAKGQTNLCDLGAGTLGGGMVTDGTFRTHSNDGTDIAILAKLGTFSEYMCLAEPSVIKVDDDYPMSAVALVSCGVATGYGSAVNRAEVKAGDTVVVVGIGGIGANAVQGARAAGASNIIAVDPVELKREKAQELGATHTASSMEDAMPMVMELTHGRMADSAILTVGVLTGDLLAPAVSLVGKGGTVVTTAIAPISQEDVKLNLFEMAMYNKQVRGTIFGSGSPRAAIPELLRQYREGRLKLDELITREYTLDEINEGYEDMRRGKNIRGVIRFD